MSKNPSLSNTTAYGAVEFPLPTRPTTGKWGPMSSKPTSMIRSHQTEEAFPDTTRLRRELEKTQSERDQATLDRDQAVRERDLLRAELEQTRKLQRQRQLATS